MNHLDLFAGIGGFSIAAEACGISDHDFVEYEKPLQLVLKKHWPDSVIYGDIRDFHPKKTYFLITGGFPCQDISRANTTINKKGIYGKRSGLWFEYLRVLTESRPTYCVIENVFDLLIGSLGVIVQDLARIGYDTTWTVIDSQYTGVPQRRRRVYILGVRDGISRSADIFKCGVRSGQVAKSGAVRINKERKWNFKEGAGEQEPVAFFTKQRSDEYGCCGVASTIAKRDYKSNTDLVLHKCGTIRGLSIGERMKLQGIPRDWMEGCGLTTTEQYKANGMTIPAVSWVIQRLLEYHKSL